MKRSIKLIVPSSIRNYMRGRQRVAIVAAAVLLIAGGLSLWCVHQVLTPDKTVVSHSKTAHQNVMTTVFWVGEAADGDNAYISNAQSAWDGQWQEHFGGYDDPDHRSGSNPAKFTPHENPFYFALPYTDYAGNGVHTPAGPWKDIVTTDLGDSLY
jgi:hypothetical protein